MGSATDVSLETADVVLTQNSLEALIKLKHLAKNMNTIIRQNLAFSILVIVSLMISNVFGLVELPQGVLAHELSTIIVILNSLRLLKVNLASS
jgi:Cd2+/Zn2+-exporting ATPase